MMEKKKKKKKKKKKINLDMPLLTSFMVRLAPDRDLDHHQNVYITCSLYHPGPLHKISLQSICWCNQLKVLITWQRLGWFLQLTFVSLVSFEVVHSFLLSINSVTVFYNFYLFCILFVLSCNSFLHSQLFIIVLVLSVPVFISFL